MRGACEATWGSISGFFLVFGVRIAIEVHAVVELVVVEVRFREIYDPILRNA